MSYNTDSSGSTLSDAERIDEAKRILNRIVLVDDWQRGLTDVAVKFVNEKLAQLEMFDSVGAVTIKQLYWLRDISSQVD